MNKINWEDSIWFSDIDDTLIDTAGTTLEASEGIKNVFTANFNEQIGNKIQNKFNNIFSIMLAGLRNKTDQDWSNSQIKKDVFEKLWQEIEGYQQEIKEKYGAAKKFSREVFIKICADREGLVVSPEIIYEAADAYWMTLSEKTKVFPGVLDLIRLIKQHKRPLYLITSSDARLKLKENGQFEYIPKYSEDFKRERVQLLRDKGIDFDLVSIGDPEDKPSLDFFQKGIKLAQENLGHKIEFSKSIIMGDSFGADLQTPKEIMGFGLAILFQQGKDKLEIIDDKQIVTGNIFQAAEFII